MSYLSFLALLILPPILILTLARKKTSRLPDGLQAAGLLGLAFIAFLYTAPWDGCMISRGVWEYGRGRIIGTLGGVPIEEYLFIIFQTFLAGLWLFRLNSFSEALSKISDTQESWWVQLIGALLWFSAGVIGALALMWYHGYYFGMILVWAAPVLALQWAYGGGFIWTRARKAWLIGTVGPSLYLFMADRLAIGLGIWHINPSRSTGILLLGLPIEEAIFFTLTNLLVTQGLLASLRLFFRIREAK